MSEPARIDWRTKIAGLCVLWSLIGISHVAHLKRTHAGRRHLRKLARLHS